MREEEEEEEELEEDKEVEKKKVEVEEELICLHLTSGNFLPFPVVISPFSKQQPWSSTTSSSKLLYRLRRQPLYET